MGKPLVQATGRRKESVARVRLYDGAGQIVLNGRALENYFPTMAQRIRVMEPLQVAQVTGRFDIQATLQGGGSTGQADALRLGIARALVGYDPELRPVLKRGGFLTRDARVVERKKYGLKKARRRSAVHQAVVPGLDLLGRPGRLFGTDGIRGVANTELTADLALALGRAAASTLDRGPVLVGRDTRVSGSMLAAALQAGLLSAAVDTIDAGVLTSGGISYLTAATGSAMGAVVSASHNPAADNGIKLLGPEGSKLSDAEEDLIEQRLRALSNDRVPTGRGVGMRAELYEAVDLYVEHLAALTGARFDGLAVALDCANGAAHRAAPELFRRLGADVMLVAAEPDGMNINDGCGATHPEFLASRAGGRIGLAFDGDADRLIAVDEDGVPANGDVIMAVVARHWAAQGRLPNRTGSGHRHVQPGLPQGAGATWSRTGGDPGGRPLRERGHAAERRQAGWRAVGTCHLRRPGSDR